MQAYLFKSAATVMAMVMAITAVVCRCGMAGCVSDPGTTAVVQPEPKSHCERGCDKHDLASDEQQAPEKCGDCGKDKPSLDRSAAAGADAVIEVELFAPVAEYIHLDTTAALLSHPSRDQETTGSPIEVLRQSCALLI
jgi:hypothetical protein